MSLMGFLQIPLQKVWSFCAWRKSFPERFDISAHGESHFPNGLEFPRSAKVISRMVYDFRAWRESFPERFGISAHGESHFPNGLAFPRSAKVVSRMVWHFRARRKSFPERFGVCALGESSFPNGLVFPHMAKVISRMVWCFRAWRKSFPEWFGISAHGESHFPNSFGACGPPANRFLKVLILAGGPQIIPQKVWSFRAWRKSFPEWLGVSVYAELICSTFRLIIYSCVCIAWRVIVYFLLILVPHSLKKYA